MVWFTLGENKPREGRNVLVKIWGRFFAARLDYGRWYLPLSDTYLKADEDDEWTALS